MSHETEKVDQITGRSAKDLEGLAHLGGHLESHTGGAATNYPATYSPELLEAFPNRNLGSDQWVSFICTEFTSLCPLTGQPDFAKIFVNYIAHEKMVESKALKLYLFSFRNHGDFHEDCVQKICNDLSKLIGPRYMEVIGEFTPRGGISIFPFSQSSNESPKFQALLEERRRQYAPGKYSMELGRVY